MDGWKNECSELGTAKDVWENEQLVISSSELLFFRFILRFVLFRLLLLRVKQSISSTIPQIFRHLTCYMSDGGGVQSSPNSPTPADTWWNAISLSSAVSTVIFVDIMSLLRCGARSQGLLEKLFSVQSECWFVVTIRFTRSWLLFCFEFFFEILSLPAATLSRTRNINWKIVIGRNINHKTHECRRKTNETHFHSKGRVADGI